MLRQVPEFSGTEIPAQKNQAKIRPAALERERMLWLLLQSAASRVTRSRQVITLGVSMRAKVPSRDAE
jgi:hypothetical protein